MSAQAEAAPFPEARQAVIGALEKFEAPVLEGVAKRVTVSSRT